MSSLVKRSMVAFGVSLLLPAAAYAQAAITGVVRDTSGGVLPGVTVEAASPVLIEKVRSVTTDETGQYRIVDLRPGTYSVTFTLPGFSTVRREGIELSGTFVATVNGDLKVGALEETITVTGETPIVDVQSARVQQTVSKDILAAIPSSRNAAGIQSLVPGMSTNTDSGGISGGVTGSAGAMYGGRSADSRTQNDGLNTGWAGAGTRRRPARQRRRLTGSGVEHIGRPRRSGNSRRGAQRHPARREQLVQRSGCRKWRRWSVAGEQLHPVAAGPGLARAGRAAPPVGDQPDGRWPHRSGQALVLPDVPRDQRQQHGAGHVVQPERGRPERVDRRLRSEPAGVHRPEEQDRDRPLTWQATPRNKINLYWAEQYNSREPRGRRQRDADAGGHRLEPVSPVAHSAGDVDLAVHEPRCCSRRAGARIKPDIGTTRRASMALTTRTWFDSSSRRRDSESRLTA